MPNTTPLRSYPYPTPDDPNDVPYNLQLALEQIETDVVALGGTAETLDTGWIDLSPGPSWTPVAGHPIRARRIGRVVYTAGAVKGPGTLSSLVILPPGFYPPGTTFIHGHTTSTGYGVTPITYELYVGPGVLGCSGYISGTLTATHILPISGTHLID